MNKLEPCLFGGKTLEEWDQKWIAVEGDLRDYQPSLRYVVGLYRCSLKGEVVALGTGTDKGGGLAKRLSDFRRPSPSGRNHYAGGRINANLDRLDVQVLITGSDEEAREVGRKLRAPMISLHQPAWTVPNAPYVRTVESYREAASVRTPGMELAGG
jgi:hypothetical protein